MILITGAAGFLGRHFARHYMDAGADLVLVDDFSSPYAEWPEPGDEWTEFIPTDAVAYFEESEAVPEIVYHFAAPVGGREKIEGDPLFNADSLRLDAALFRWAAKAKPKVIVYPSSSAVYGVGWQGEGHQALHESLFSPSFEDAWDVPDEMYGFTKLVGEVLAWKAARYGVNTLCIRPFSGYGEDQSMEYPMPSIIDRVKHRRDPLTIWGPGHQSRDFIHVDDVVAATVKRIEAGIDGYVAMNIGTGIPTSFEHLAKKAARLAGYQPSIECLPDKPFGVMHRYCDPTEMLKYHVPEVSLTEGIRRMLHG
jgi:nucleoside-diphosphate-sugar epimerase